MRQTQNAQKKDNRKSIFVIGLLLLLVAVIGFGGYTLSKYVTKKEAKGNASVAKWGFTVNADATNLFGAKYKYDTAKNSSVATTDDTATFTVKADDNTNRVAPGTTGSMTFTIGGTAEVKAAIAIEMTGIKDVSLKYTADGVTGAQEYNPVKWTLKKGENVLVDNLTLAKIAEELNKDVYDATINPGDSYANAATYTIEWKWDFEGGNDALDTFLGTIAHTPSTTTYGNYTKVADTSTEIAFDLKISITQVKE